MSKLTVRCGPNQVPVHLVDVVAGGAEVTRPRKFVRGATLPDGSPRDGAYLYPGDPPVMVDDCRYYQQRIKVGDLVEVKPQAAVIDARPAADVMTSATKPAPRAAKDKE